MDEVQGEKRAPSKADAWMEKVKRYEQFSKEELRMILIGLEESNTQMKMSIDMVTDERNVLMRSSTR